ncbi:MAG: BMC domain-containing protein [Clostridiales Family XIII bacterium]|jgi:microcompartment protein CcmL/EutN|nr:BMC domain-containing protein [Clostridiales Family XIII bacterium]
MKRTIGMLELSSISRGFYIADKMIKISKVEIITASSTCPGKYIIIVHGDTASVENSVKTGEKFAEGFFVDSIIISNVEEQVFPAITGTYIPENIEALGIVESFSMANMLISADAILKSAMLSPIDLRLGTGLGGKAYFTFTGEVSAVETGVNTAKKIAKKDGLLLNAEVIPSPAEELIEALF